MTTMQAIVRDRYGAPEVLALRDIAVPAPRDHEVRVRVHASSVNPADWFSLTGRPLAARLAFGLMRPRDAVLGMDVAGEVEAVGARVTRFRVGDAVYGEAARAYAEHACVAEDRLALKPRNLSFEEAASVPLAGITALQGLRDSAKIKHDSHVCINGASGGVGTFAVQIARALGAEVTGVCSTRNAELVRSIGADHVIDYTREDFTAHAKRYDAILDLVGSASIARCRRALRPGGVYISSVGRLGWIGKSFFASLLPGPRVAVLVTKATPQDLAVLTELAEAGALRPVIDRRYALAEVPEALRRQGEGHARGKSIIRMRSA
jgi:NADPH:quinone reductase-like Zn-dependent oxidoreductase